MASPQDTFKQLLKSKHYSVTSARLAVFASLEGQDPQSMHTLVERTPSIDRASIYRAVALFEELGIVQRINIGWKYKLELSDLFAGHHHHLSCLNCKQSIAISEEALEVVIAQLSHDYAFTPTNHQIEIQGYCSSCQALLMQQVD